MKELKTILSEYDKIDFSVRKAAIATVVKVKGSSYRSPGARMLITDDGKWVGSISGGCLEGDALRKARQVMTNNKPMTVTYDTREDSNQNLGIGLGCNGVIDVLIEPVRSSSDEIIRLFKQIIDSNRTYALATVTRSSTFTGAKILLDEGGEKISLLQSDFADTIVEDLKSAFATRKSESKSYRYHEEDVEVFIELIQPSVTLVIFGGGFDARPVSHLAKSLGWTVTVTDECVAHIAPVFFPEADNLSLCNRKYIDRDFIITPYTACVLMSHNYEYDRDVLRRLLETDTPYIGILGPRKRFDKMAKEFSAEGIVLTDRHLNRIHSPIGLDIGAETPDEIAVSIIGEIQGKFAQRSGGFLKYRTGPIHTRDGRNDQVFKQVFLSRAEDKKIAGI
jgi:xanthine/CO dehydrogenase XdhC/CoxF family maturation factor